MEIQNIPEISDEKKIIRMFALILADDRTRGRVDSSTIGLADRYEKYILSGNTIDEK